MPEENLLSESSLEVTLERLEDRTTKNYLDRVRYYDVIEKALEKGLITKPQMERVLLCCVNDMRNEKKLIATVFNIIYCLINKITPEDISIYPDLLQAALAVVDTLKTAGEMLKLKSLRKLGIDTLLLFPKDTLLKVVRAKHCEILEIINIYFTLSSLQEDILQICTLLGKLLKILPEPDKNKFVNAGLTIWFSKLIPTVMTMYAQYLENSSLIFIEVLELLTEELAGVEYHQSMEFNNLVEKICNRNEYPKLMKNLLQSGSSVWHRLWIVFIKLLNQNMTKNTSNFGTPINSMLPIVEKAFKLDGENRCRSFLCWDVLIDNLSTEINDGCVSKRLKLLIVPLQLRNAKTSDVAEVKFTTWWLLIRKFETNIDNYIDVVLIPFLHFCFGKPGSFSFVPGQISYNLKVQCAQAFVEIIGHIDCDGCTQVSRLQKRLISTDLIINYWNDWIHSLKLAIHIIAMHNKESSKQQVKCMWKSFILIISKLPDNSLRKDLVMDLLKILESLLKENREDPILPDYIFNCIIVTSFTSERNIKKIFKGVDFLNGPLKKVVTLLLDPSMASYYDSINSNEIIDTLKPVMDTILDKSYSSPNHVIEWVLKEFPANECLLIFWTAMSKNIAEYETDVCPLELCNMIIWPLNNMDKFSNVAVAAIPWYTMYISIFTNINKTIMNEQIMNVLSNCSESNTLILCAILAVLKLSVREDAEFEKKVKLLQQFTSNLNNYEELKDIYPILADTLVALVTLVQSSINETLAHSIILCVKHYLAGIAGIAEPPPVLFENLLKSTMEMFKVNLYSKHITILGNELRQLSIKDLKNDSSKDIVHSMLNLLNKTIHDNENTVKVAIENAKVCTSSSEKGIFQNGNFTKPGNKETPKHTKKKESSIVNTVFENGEEYVVVKSNWKFNPRKLTENQKEKLQRKREDIPALYQDLSQSQDEFKNTLWKTDSQDTTTSSECANVEIISELKELPCSNIVPNVIETILNHHDKKGFSEINENMSEVPAAVKQPRTPKCGKIPRILLKERVFRNVRNLIEKSAANSNTNVNTTDAQVHFDSTGNTPQSKLNVNNLANSAPPLLSADRPSRLKRMPKKFVDTEIFAIKRSRHSCSVSHKHTEDFKETKDSSIENSIEKNNDLTKSGKVDNLTEADSNLAVNIVKPITKTSASEETVEDNIGKDNVEKQKSLIVDEKVKTSSSLENMEQCEYIVKTVSENVSESISKSIDKIEDKCFETMYGNNLKDDAATNAEKTPETKIENKPLGVICGKSIDQSETIGSLSKPNEISDNQISNTTKDLPIFESIDVASDIKVDQKTPKAKLNMKNSNDSKPLTKKSNKISRIEKELAIDMVEGHPILKLHKRSTRKNLESNNIGRRSNLANKINKAKLDFKNSKKATKKPKAVELAKEVTIIDNSKKNECSGLSKSQNDTDFSCSEDIIESSQDSTFTPISVSKKTPKKELKVVIEIEKNLKITPIQKIIQDSDCQTISPYDQKLCSDYISSENKTSNLFDDVPTQDKSEEFKKIIYDSNNSIQDLDSDIMGLPNTSSNQENKDHTGITPDNDDTDIPKNRTAEEQNKTDLTENMDTQPFTDNNTLSDDVLLLNNEAVPISTSTEQIIVGTDTQEIAEADTQDLVSQNMLCNEICDLEKHSNLIDNVVTSNEALKYKDNNSKEPITSKDTDFTKTLTDSFESRNILDSSDTNEVSSPFKDDVQRKKDFLNSTLEISPIKIVSPDRNAKSPSPERSTDYVVIKLSSPVQSNGERFEKSESPEFFTEDKISPDKRDLSPPRSEINLVTNNSSPSSLLSLKKNRPQVRTGGRAAQMLGLCVPDKLNSIMKADRNDPEETKRNSPTNNTPVRRNLRLLYNTSSDNDITKENEENQHFLKLKRSLPSVDSSPSGPILKRKLADIVDETTISPASKRKRVSFQDPPVSTTIAVQKYIEPCEVRSPQSSQQKRLERQMRSHTNMMSRKKLDIAYKHDSVELSKALESFNEVDLVSSSDDTQLISSETAPAIEIVRSSDLNDKDPICPELIACNDPIDNVASKLASSTTKTWLVKELLGKIETIGDLARLTELDVNRLCIKAPKVKTAKKILDEYAARLHVKLKEKTTIGLLENQHSSEQSDVSEILQTKETNVSMDIENSPVTETTLEPNTCDVEVPTYKVALNDTAIQTTAVICAHTDSQTDSASTSQVSAQTEQSGAEKTADIITSCLAERNDFIDQLKEKLDESSIGMLVEKLPFEAITEHIVKKLTNTNSTHILDRVLEGQNALTQCSQSNESRELEFLQHYIVKRYESKSLILFCSQLLENIYNKDT